MAETIQKTNRKILVVEDSRTQAEYLRHILENEGYRVTLAENGVEALEQLTIDRPALVFTDVLMPEMDGYELCRRIKTTKTTADIPVILVTQLFDPGDVIRGLECGADDFIIKPFESAYIRSRITTIQATMQQPNPDGSLPALPVTVGEKTYMVSASRLRIFQILLSTYEVAVSKNAELLEAQDRLGTLNDQLQKAVEDLKQSNARLTKENIERERVKKALDEANTKLNLMASITRHDVINQLTSQHEALETALSLRAKDPDLAWEHIATAAEIATQTLNSVRFTGEYQKVGVKAPLWLNLHALVVAAAKHTPAAGDLLSNNLPADREVYADPLVENVFANLIDNAIKYGRKITFVRFSLVDEGDTAVIICEDDGVGIPVSKKELVFTYEYGMSVGLGLFLSREILAITGLSLHETGVEGRGARFEIRCPKGTIRNVQAGSA